MSETVQELVDRMAAEEWPEPALLQAIVDKGEEAVAPLLEILRRERSGEEEEEAVYTAVGLLTHLPRSEAVVPVVMDLFRRYPEGDLLEFLPDVLVPYGPAVIDPLLDVVRDHTSPWYSATVASNIALHLTVGNAEQFEREKAVLREGLAGLLAKPHPHAADDYHRADSFVSDLAAAADPEARPLITAAIKANLSELTEKSIDRLYRNGPKVDIDLLGNYLEFYREQYQEYQDDRRAAPPAPPGPPVPRTIVNRYETSTKATVFKVPAASAPARKIGRNDPCWCGSGKKYKNCHLHIDQG